MFNQTTKPSITANDMRVQAIQRLYHSNDAAQAMLNHFADREKDCFQLSVDRLTKSLKAIPRQQLVYLLRELERAGVGNFISGRRGHSSRFAWNVSLNSVGKVARSKSGAQFKPITKATDAPDTSSVDPTMPRKPSGSGFTIKIEMSPDATPAERKKLAEYILKGGISKAS